MKILSSINDVLRLNSDLSQFITSTCPWISPSWDPKQIGYIFVLDEDDLEDTLALPVAEDVSINLDLYNLFEGDPIYDPDTQYWNLVGIIGQEYGFSVFLPDKLINHLPNLRRKLNHLI